MKYAIIVAALVVGGCAQSVPPPSEIAPPSARLMTPPERLGEIKSGTDLVVEHLKLRRQYLKETERLKSLQGYVKTVRSGP